MLLGDGLSDAERKRNQRDRQRQDLGSDEYKKMRAEEMRAYRAKKKQEKQQEPKQQQPIIIPKLKSLDINELIKSKKKTRQEPEPEEQLQRQVQVVKDYIPNFKKPNAQPITEQSKKTYLSHFKQMYKFIIKKDFNDKLKNELIKVLENKAYNKKYILSEVTPMIKNTVELVKKIKERYPSPNSQKVVLNSIVSIISRIEEFNKEYQLLAPINTQKAKEYEEDRNKNEVNSKDNKKIFNFEPKFINQIISKIKSILDKALFAVYTLNPPRRLDYQYMIITNETNKDKLKNKNYNYLVIKNNKPFQFIFNKYKTNKTFGQQVININKELIKNLNEYIQDKKLKNNDYLFGLISNPKEKNDNFSNKVSTVFTNALKSSETISNKWIRVSFATYLNKLNLSIKQREEQAYKMAHSFKTNLQYGKQIINIDDID